MTHDPAQTHWRPPGTTMPVQVDETTCGIAALAAVGARAGRVPVLRGYLDAPPERVRAIQLRAHGIASKVGAIHWPEALGTSPWSLADMAGRATGNAYVTRPWGQSARVMVDQAAAAGEDSFLYVGGGTYGAAAGTGRVQALAETAAARLDDHGLDRVPRHVVAVLGPESTPNAWAVFEPASGNVIAVDPDELMAPHPPRRPSLGWWRRPIFAVLPRLGARTVNTTTTNRTDQPEENR